MRFRLLRSGKQVVASLFSLTALTAVSPAAMLSAAMLSAATLSIACGDSTQGDATGGGGSGASGGDGGDGGAGAGAPTTIKVMNWNLRNFFNDKVDSPDVDDETVVSASVYNGKVASVAAVLRNNNPDIAVFAEVENLSVLEALNAELDEQYPHLIFVGGNDFRGLDLAAISKFPVEVVSHKSDQFQLEGGGGDNYFFARDCAEYHVTVNGQGLVFLGTHFRSKGPPDDADKRLAEAQRCRAIADEVAASDPSLGVAILGDFNDLPGSPPVLAAIGSDPTFENAADLVPASDRYTFTFQGTQELIDHQIVNPVLAEMLVSGEIIHGGSVDSASDHAPLVITYQIN